MGATNADKFCAIRGRWRQSIPKRCYTEIASSPPLTAGHPRNDTGDLFIRQVDGQLSNIYGNDNLMELNGFLTLGNLGP